MHLAFDVLYILTAIACFGYSLPVLALGSIDFYANR